MEVETWFKLRVVAKFDANKIKINGNDDDDEINNGSTTTTTTFNNQNIQIIRNFEILLSQKSERKKS